jgi:hypothetical protein
MKTLIITLTAACAVVASYFGIRYFMHRDLGFTPAWKYVRNLANNLLHTEITAAREAGATTTSTTEHAV